MSDLASLVRELARPYPAAYVKQVQGEDYVPHGIVVQRLTSIFGVPPSIELLREIYDADKLTGVVMRMRVPGFAPVDEAGECDNPQAKTNGARLKSACSDAYKRCAMRLTNGLHLWCGNDYFLYDSLTKREESAVASRTPQEEGGALGKVPSSPPPSAVSGISTEELVSKARAHVKGKSS